MRSGIKIVFAVALAFAVAGSTPTATPQSPTKHAEVPEEQRVDINHASIEELMRVPGITKSWAGRIVRFRPYRSKNELLDRGVVSGEVYSRIKDYIIAHRKP